MKLDRRTGKTSIATGVLLVQDGIGGNGGLAGLAVADDQLTLATADGEHRVDGQNAGCLLYTSRCV